MKQVIDARVTAPLVAAVEAGGTKFDIMVGRSWDAPLATGRITTRDPEATLQDVADFLWRCEADHGPIEAVGIAAFGPIGVDPARPGYGQLRTTPKPGWSGVDLAGRIAGSRPYAVDTDVNAAAVAESRWVHGFRDTAYITVGTGVGVGLVLDGHPRHGLLHPEAGHLPLRRQPGDAFPGVCPFHRDCAEGLVSGPALLARLGRRLTFDEAGPAEVASFVDYLGQLCANLLLVASVEAIVIGGGVMSGLPAHPLVEDRMRHWLGGYIDVPHPVGGFITAPRLGTQSGVAGAFALTQSALNRI